MLSPSRSILVWFLICLLIVVWLPLLSVIRIFDRDPVAYRTGRMFRRLGKAMTQVNPSWQVIVSGEIIENVRNPYVVVSNHQSLADIPIISNLPWEMKWIGKDVLFRLPIIGWMMKLSKDIAVDRDDARSGARALLKARDVLTKHCSIMMFPEGTRSRDGRIYRFTDGAFHLAIKAQVPVLPIAVDGSFNCLPKNTWRFGEPSTINVKVLPAVPTLGFTSADLPALREKVRSLIVAQVVEWRGDDPSVVDATAAQPVSETKNPA